MKNKNERQEVGDITKILSKSSLIEIYKAKKVYYHGLIKDMPSNLEKMEVNFVFTMEEMPGLFIYVTAGEDHNEGEEQIGAD